MKRDVMDVWRMENAWSRVTNDTMVLSAGAREKLPEFREQEFDADMERFRACAEACFGANDYHTKEVLKSMEMYKLQLLRCGGVYVDLKNTLIMRLFSTICDELSRINHLDDATFKQVAAMTRLAVSETMLLRYVDLNREGETDEEIVQNLKVCRQLHMQVNQAILRLINSGVGY